MYTLESYSPASSSHFQTYTQLPSADLFARKIVGKSIRDAADIRGPHVTEILRVRPVLKAILARIELDREMYYKMRDVLLSDSIIADAPGLMRYLPQGIYWFTLMHAHIL